MMIKKAYSICSRLNEATGVEYFVVHRLYFGCMKSHRAAYYWPHINEFGWYSDKETRFETEEQAEHAIDSVTANEINKALEEMNKQIQIAQNKKSNVFWKKKCRKYVPKAYK